MGIKIDQVFLGTCTNSRVEDWEIVAKIVQGKKKADNIRFIAVPGSIDVMKETIERGYYQTLVEFGAIMVPPGCGPCVGIHAGVPADNEVCLTTQNRNFQGRMGNPEAKIYLASPATIAASAIAGVIDDPRKYSKELKNISRTQLIDTQALKILGRTAQKTIERVANDAAQVIGPKAKDASEKFESMAQKAIAQYGPKAQKAVSDFEKAITKLAGEASKAVKGAMKTKGTVKSKTTAKKANRKPAARKKSAKRPGKR